MKRYAPTPIFRLASVLLALGAVLLGIDAWRRSDPFLAIFAIGAAVVAVFMIPASFARAEFDGRTLTYHTPLRGSHQIDRGQIERVELGGRRFRALIIGYHPRAANGHIETGQLKYINLPPLEDQLELYELLGGEMEDAD